MLLLVNTYSIAAEVEECKEGGADEFEKEDQERAGYGGLKIVIH